MAKGFRGNSFGNKSGALGGMKQADLMKQAQKMQEEMLKTQEELEARTFSASAGGGVVKAEVSGKRQLVSLTIDLEAVDPDDVDMLQDMVVAAVNSALSEAESTYNETMSKLTGGLGLGF